MFHNLFLCEWVGTVYDTMLPVCRGIQQELAGGLAASASDRQCSGCVQLALHSQPTLAAKAINPDEMNSAVQVYMQLGAYSSRQRALQLLCQQVLNEPLFNELRTEQQLGYSVFISPSAFLCRWLVCHAPRLSFMCTRLSMQCHTPPPPPLGRPCRPSITTHS